ncbi:unnamed protein product, partial [Choristocarpus tenellus]
MEVGNDGEGGRHPLPIQLGRAASPPSRSLKEGGRKHRAKGKEAQDYGVETLASASTRSVSLAPTTLNDLPGTTSTPEVVNVDSAKTGTILLTTSPKAMGPGPGPEGAEVPPEVPLRTSTPSVRGQTVSWSGSGSIPKIRGSIGPTVGPKCGTKSEEPESAVLMVDLAMAEEAEDARVLGKNRFFLTKEEKKRRNRLEAKQKLLAAKAERDSWATEQTVDLSLEDGTTPGGTRQLKGGGPEGVGDGSHAGIEGEGDCGMEFLGGTGTGGRRLKVFKRPRVLASIFTPQAASSGGEGGGSGLGRKGRFRFGGSMDVDDNVGNGAVRGRNQWMEDVPFPPFPHVLQEEPGMFLGSVPAMLPDLGLDEGDCDQGSLQPSFFSRSPPQFLPGGGLPALPLVPIGPPKDQARGAGSGLLPRRSVSVHGLCGSSPWRLAAGRTTPSIKLRMDTDKVKGHQREGLGLPTPSEFVFFPSTDKIWQGTETCGPCPGPSPGPCIGPGPNSVPGKNRGRGDRTNGKRTGDGCLDACGVLRGKRDGGNESSLGKEGTAVDHLEETSSLKEKQRAIAAAAKKRAEAPADALWTE